MKSKRPEEQKNNAVSRQWLDWPGFFQQNASRILLGITLAILAVLIIRYRIASTQQRQLTARASAIRARQDLLKMKEAIFLPGAAPEQIAAARDQLTRQIMADLSEVLNDTTDSDSSLRADAYAIRGDLYWTLANSPVFPEATTRPALGLKDSPDTLLGEAEADYRHIIEQYPSELMDWATAQFGLAAIAENRSNWDDAQKHLQDVQNRPAAPDMLKSTAQIQLGLLERIRQPVLVGPYPSTSSTSQPISTQPVSATAPATTTATQSSR